MNEENVGWLSKLDEHLDKKQDEGLEGIKFNSLIYYSFKTINMIKRRKRWMTIWIGWKFRSKAGRSVPYPLLPAGPFAFDPNFNLDSHPVFSS